MDEKLTAGLVTFAVVLPICSFCVLGPAMFSVFFAGVFGWFAVLNPVLAADGAIIVGILIYAYAKRKRENSTCTIKEETIKCHHQK